MIIFPIIQAAILGSPFSDTPKKGSNKCCRKGAAVITQLTYNLGALPDLELTNTSGLLSLFWPICAHLGSSSDSIHFHLYLSTDFFLKMSQLPLKLQVFVQVVMRLILATCQQMRLKSNHFLLHVLCSLGRICCSFLAHWDQAFHLVFIHISHNMFPCQETHNEFISACGFADQWEGAVAPWHWRGAGDGNFWTFTGFYQPCNNLHHTTCLFVFTFVGN